MFKMENDQTKISLQLPVELLQKLELIANETDNTISRITRLAIKEYIKKYEENK